MNIPTLHGYWDHPTPSDIGEPFGPQIYEAVGRALSTWEILEEAIAMVFALVVEGKTQASARAFGSILSSKGRHDALEAAAAIFFTVNNVPEEDQKDFSLLMSHYGRGGGCRNEIAHAIVAGFGEKEKSAIYFLVPPVYHTKKIHMSTSSITKPVPRANLLKYKYRFIASDIDAYRFKFLAIYMLFFENYRNLAKFRK